MSGAWQVKIEPDGRWGPFAYTLSARHFATYKSFIRFAWTFDGAMRKAERWIKKLEAGDARRVAQTITIKSKPGGEL